jgi:hypothetical protein
MPHHCYGDFEKGCSLRGHDTGFFETRDSDFGEREEWSELGGKGTGGTGFVCFEELCRILEEY